ncbi:hypothetical protein HOY82DRAFT_601660 [Tuber indicum]|nr:hypothetical protein HOY82DRAFT_601660 [Tuber indicum]
MDSARQSLKPSPESWVVLVVWVVTGGHGVRLSLDDGPRARQPGSVVLVKVAFVGDILEGTAITPMAAPSSAVRCRNLAHPTSSESGRASPSVRRQSLLSSPEDPRTGHSDALSLENRGGLNWPGWRAVATSSQSTVIVSETTGDEKW